MNIRVRMVLTASPPITVIANGAPIILTYSALPIASGNMATMVVMAVIKYWRTLDMPATIRARDLRYPFLIKRLEKSIRIIPLLTTIPRRIKNR